MKNNQSLAKRLADNNDKMVKFMERIAGAMEAINDSNTLHSKSIDANTNAIVEMVKANMGVMNFIRLIFITLIAAIIVLAGAKSALDFIPFF